MCLVLIIYLFHLELFLLNFYMKRGINLISHSHDIPKKENTELCNEHTQISQKVISNMGKNKMHSNILINLKNWYQAPGMRQ